MGCGCSKVADETEGKQPTANGGKPPAASPPVKPSAPPCGAAAPAAPSAPKAPAVPTADWAELHYFKQFTDVVPGGSGVPSHHLVVHDNKAGGLARLSVVRLADGVLEPVEVRDTALAATMDLECLFRLPKEVIKESQDLFVAMTSNGQAFLLKVSKTKAGSWVAHDVYSFEVKAPTSEQHEGYKECEGARAFVEAGRLYMEYSCRGGCGKDGKPLSPWVTHLPLDLAAIRGGMFMCNPATLPVTHWPATVDGDPLVRQCADMGQHLKLAKYGQLYAAAYDDEAHEVAFRSYVMERVPPAPGSTIEAFKPLFKVPGMKIEAILDLTVDFTVFASDDEGQGGCVCVFNKHSGKSAKAKVVPPAGQDPRAYGVSGIAPVDPSVVLEEGAPARAAAPPEVHGWRDLVHKSACEDVLQGEEVPPFYLVVHDNKKPGLARLSVVRLADGVLEPVEVRDERLSKAMDLECLFRVPKAFAGEEGQDVYVAMTSNGLAFLFKVGKDEGGWVAHSVSTFSVHAPANEPKTSDYKECEGARCYVNKKGKLILEYSCRGGIGGNGIRLSPWVTHVPLDLAAIRTGTFECDAEKLKVTYWPDTIDHDPKVRQCADMGQHINLAKYGQLYAAAYDDEEHEKHFRSYIMEREPRLKAGKTENYKMMFEVPGLKIEAILDLTPNLSIFASDDEGHGGVVSVFNRHDGLSWRVKVVPPEGQDPRAYGVSGIAPVDPSVPC